MEENIVLAEKKDTRYPIFLSRVLYVTFGHQDHGVLSINSSPFDHCLKYDFRDVENYLSNSLFPLPSAIIIPFNTQYQKAIRSFCSQLEKNKNIRSTPVIMISDSGDSAEVRRLHFSGVDDLISNNITTGELVQKIYLLMKIKGISSSINSSLSNYINNNTWVPKRRSGRIVKRSLDILVSSVLLLLLSPLMLVIALLIKMDSRGPIIYASKRSGTDFKVFDFLKFRTMVQDADKKLKNLKNQYSQDSEAGTVFYKFDNDPRITKVGAFLRRTSLDELPQLVNVLRGDMSLVGNRPLPLYEAQALTVDEYVERFDAPAGITGLWQVTKRGKKEMSVNERIALDIFYAKHQSLGFDMKILMETPKAMVQEEDV